MAVHDDNLIFDRLADGELSTAERKELLSTLDGRPDGWRRCALAFIEAQVWRGDLSSLLIQDAPPMVVQAAVTMPTSRPGRPSKETRWLESSFAVAATALLAFGIGWKMNSAGPGTSNQQGLASKNSAAQRPLADSRDALTLVVQDDHGRPHRVRVPLIDADQLGGQWAEMSPDVPVDVRTGLKDRGFDLKNRRRFAPLFFEQDEQLVPMVVPVNDTYVVPVDRPVY